MSVLSPLRAITIFISYANTYRQDISLFKKLINHLSPLFSLYPTLQYYSSSQSDNSPTTQLIEAPLNQADLILLLISSDFLASKQDEIQRILEIKKAQSAHVICVLLRPTDWDIAPLSQYHPLPSDGKPVNTWPNKDAALTDVAQGVHKIVKEIATQEPRSVQSSPQSVFLYDPPNAYDTLFTDREPILKAVSSFFTSARAGRTALLALSGLSGVGKTSIAKEYCDTHSTTYQDIFWFNASSRLMLNSYMHTIADQISLPRAVRENEGQFFDAVKRWLHDRPSWLLVLDHIQDMTLLNLIVPRSSNGHVLLTTQTWNAEKHAFVLSVPPMDIDSGALFLLRRTQTLSAQAPLKHAPKEVADQAREISYTLDGIPVVLDQAGAYLQRRGGGFANYLTLYKQQRTHVLSKGGQVADNQYALLTEILAPTLDALQNTTEMSLLHLLSFLHPDIILEGLLMNSIQALHEPLLSPITDSLFLHEALDKLHHFCLVRYQADGTVLQIQRSIQNVLIDRLTAEQQLHWAQQAVRLINHAFPDVRFDTQAVCERYLPQVQHCAALITTYHLTLKEGVLLLERLGSFCLQRASYSEAKTYLTLALRLYKRHLREDLLDTAQTLNSLGRLYYRQAKYKKAEGYHQRALKIRERVLGPDDPKTAESLHNLALINWNLGKYQEAERLYLLVLAVEERVKGANDPDVADTLNNLGLVYAQQGRYAEAKKVYRRALSLYRRSSIANHPDQAYPLNGLGTLEEKQGNIQQAEKLYKQALTIRQHAFGKVHPEVARSINKLAGIAASRNDYQQAEKLYKQALTISEQTLGSKHPDVAAILNNQALLATRQRQYPKAQLLYQRALSIYKFVFGPQHPTVASVLNNLGQLSRMREKVERAEKFLRDALFIREKILGAKHPSIAQSLGNLADVLANQGRYEEAEPLFQRAFVLYLQLPTPRHPDVALVPENYACLMEHTNRSEKARELREAARGSKEPPSTQPL